VGVLDVGDGLALGTYAGGWRIIRTLGRKIIDLRPPEASGRGGGQHGCFRFGIGLGAPISTTHTITSAIMGVGATKKLSAVRWGVAGNSVGAWILTFPGAGLIAALAYFRRPPILQQTAVVSLTRPHPRDLELWLPLCRFASDRANHNSKIAEAGGGGCSD
jgi:hypothetical protein